MSQGLESINKRKVSFVVAARNDNYGGNLLHRMQVFINNVMGLANNYELNAELVIIEWNPPPDRPRLKDALDWSFCSQNSVRIVEVPSEIHRSLINSDRMPMFEYIAKNTGIRRSTGEYVVSTNPDLLYSDSLIRFLARGRLSRHNFYRVDRYDVDALVPLDIPITKQLSFCTKHVIRVNPRGGTIFLSRPPVGFGTLDLSARLAFQGLKNFTLGRNRIESQVHTNASGDFLLMPRESWLSLGGYPELPTNSHIDGYMCVMAVSAGLRQKLLRRPLVVYHQEHERPVNFNKVEESSRPVTNYHEWVSLSKQMLALKKPHVFHGEGWGLANETLLETRINC